MKKFVIVIALFLFTINADSQIQFGISGGMNFSYVKPEIATIGGYTIGTTADNYTGFHIGAMSRISILGIFIQPELLYTAIGYQMRIDELVEGREQRNTLTNKINRFDIPVLIGANLGPVRIGIGPVGSIILSESSNIKNYIEEANVDVDKSMTLGWQFGIGIDISKLSIDVKYEGGLSSLGNGVTVGGVEREFDSRPRQIIVSLGFMLN